MRFTSRNQQRWTTGWPRALRSAAITDRWLESERIGKLSAIAALRKALRHPGNWVMGRLLITILLLVVGLTPATAETVKVVGVYTGDTFAVERQGEEVKVRLYGVDAPVAGQHGNVSSKRFLKRLIQGLTLQMNVVGRDVFDTPLAIAVREGKESSVNAAIVSQGYAWVNPQTCSLEPCEQWKRLESQARKLKLGIWSGFDLVPPWEFRQAQTR